MEKHMHSTESTHSVSSGSSDKEIEYVDYNKPICIKSTGKEVIYRGYLAGGYIIVHPVSSNDPYYLEYVLPHQLKNIPFVPPKNVRYIKLSEACGDWNGNKVSKEPFDGAIEVVIEDQTR